MRTARWNTSPAGRARGINRLSRSSPRATIASTCELQSGRTDCQIPRPRSTPVVGENRGKRGSGSKSKYKSLCSLSVARDDEWTGLGSNRRRRKTQDKKSQGQNNSQMASRDASKTGSIRSATSVSHIQRRRSLMTPKDYNMQSRKTTTRRTVETIKTYYCCYYYYYY